MLAPVVVVQPIVLDQLLHQPRANAPSVPGSGAMLVALLSRLGAAWVDADQPGAVALGGLRVGPEVQVGGDGIAAPDQDQLAAREVAVVHADLAATGLDQCIAASHGADGCGPAARAPSLLKKRPAWPRPRSRPMVPA